MRTLRAVILVAPVLFALWTALRTAPAAARAGEAVQVAQRLPEPPSQRREGHAEKGFLDVESDPPAEILIDDAATGKVTPQRLELEAGHHKLTLVSTRDRARRRTIGFNVDAGKTTKLAIHLSS